MTATDLGYTGRRSRPNHAATDENRDPASPADWNASGDVDQGWDRDSGGWEANPGPGTGWDAESGSWQADGGAGWDPTSGGTGSGTASWEADSGTTGWDASKGGSADEDTGWDDGLGEPEPGYPGWSEAEERYGADEPPARRGRGLLGGR